MATQLNLSELNFCGEQLLDISELAFDATIKAPDFEAIHTIYTNIVVNKQFGFIGKGGLVGVKNQGCDPTPQNWEVATRKMEFDPVKWEVLLSICFTDLEGTAAVFARNKGKDIADLTSSEYVVIITQVLEMAIKDFFYRIGWFGDADIATAGTLTAGVSAEYFDLLDGFFKQMEAQATANPKQRVVIAENAAADHDAQLDVPPTSVSDYFKEAYKKASIILRTQTDKFFLTTQSIYDAYVLFHQENCCLESTVSNMVNGMQELKFNGVPIIAMPIWTEIITSYFDNGTTYDNPNRLVFTTKSNLAVGVDTIDSFSDLNVWYERKDRRVYIETMGMFDFKLANPEMFVYGY